MSKELTVEVADPSLMPEVLELLEEMGCLWMSGDLPTKWCTQRDRQLIIDHHLRITYDSPPFDDPSDLIIGEK